MTRANDDKIIIIPLIFIVVLRNQIWNALTNFTTCPHDVICTP